MSDVGYGFFVDFNLRRVDDAVETLEAVECVHPMIRWTEASRDCRHVLGPPDGSYSTLCGAYVEQVPGETYKREADVVLEDPNDRWCDACRAHLAAKIEANWNQTES